MAIMANQRITQETPLTSGSSGKMLSTSLLYRGLSAPQQPQTPEENVKQGGKRKKGENGQLEEQR